MYEDDILLEVRRAREEYAASHGYDIRAMVADLRRMDEAGDWPVVSLTPKRNLISSPQQLLIAIIIKKCHWAV